MLFASTEDMFTPDIGFIETFSGGRFHPHTPDFQIEDIAHSLSNLCRYNGHCRDFYSVAEHSVLVADIMQLKYGSTRSQCLEGLLHDATEAYLSDIPAPFKQYFPELGIFDKKLDKAVRKAYDLPEKQTTACKSADLIALFIEAFHLLRSGGAIFHDPYDLRREAIDFMYEFDLYPRCLGPKDAKRSFLLYYRDLDEIDWKGLIKP